MHAQVADVNKPLLRISNVADMGCECVFGQRGGYLLDVHRRSKVPIQRRGKLYVWKVCCRDAKPTNGLACHHSFIAEAAVEVFSVSPPVSSKDGHAVVLEEMLLANGNGAVGGVEGKNEVMDDDVQITGASAGMLPRDGAAVSIKKLRGFYAPTQRENDAHTATLAVPVLVPALRGSPWHFRTPRSRGGNMQECTPGRCRHLQNHEIHNVKAWREHIIEL